MKRLREELVQFILLILLALILFSNNTYAYMCDDGFSATECVCGHTPNSQLGYGQVIIGMNVYSCNNFEDGICPEDFTNGTVAGNCSSCPDYDCNGYNIVENMTTYVSGHVYDKNSNPIDKVLIRGNPVKWDPTADLDRNTTSSISGFYSSSEFITGTYYFSASKDGYDTQLLKTTFNRESNTSINFTLQDGTCHEDCTNSYNRCNAACDGVTFGNGTASCNFYNNEVKTLCNNREFGTQVRLPESYGGNSTYAYFVDCCEGSPELKYYAKAQTGGDIKNLIKVEKIAKYNDVPVIVIISYWQK